MRIIAFVGSPVEDNEKEVSFCLVGCFYLFHSQLIFQLILICVVQLVKMAKRLKKEKVNVDIVNFGEEVRRFFFLLCP